MNWIKYNWEDESSRPPKPGRYLIYREGCDKMHFEQWNGSGWANSNKDCTHWSLPSRPSENKNLTPEQILELGIEIVSAMKASCFNWDIEEGRIDALMETEVDRLEGVDKEEWDSWKPERQQRWIEICKMEKERLHKQAKYVAEITLEKYKDIHV